VGKRQASERSSSSEPRPSHALGQRAHAPSAVHASASVATSLTDAFSDEAALVDEALLEVALFDAASDLILPAALEDTHSSSSSTLKKIYRSITNMQTCNGKK